jgi:hypothetical protein
VVVAVSVLALVVEAAVVLPGWSVFVLIAIAAWMAAPGVAVARGCMPSQTHAAWLAGPAIGFGLSVFGSFLWWAAGVRNAIALAAGPALPWALAWWVRRVGAPALRLPPFTTRDVSIAAMLVLIVPLVTSVPYDHVREPVAGGEAYRAYFTADFIWAMTVTSELAKGDVPPANPFLRDQPLHYYWMAHFLSGSVYRSVAGLGVRSEAVILVNGIVFGAAFVLFAYVLVRALGASPGASALAVLCGFCANSYEGTDMIRAVIVHGLPWSELANTNIDAVTRWFYKGMAVDGLQRLLLYQPHHLTGYALALAALWLVALAEDVTDAGVALGAGCLLGLALLFSTFGALIDGVAVALLYLLRLVQQRALKRLWQCAVLGAGPVLLGVVATSVLGYTDTRYGSLLQVGLNPVAAHDIGRVWLWSFGPLLLGAIAVCTTPRWLLREGAAPAALAATATAFWFFTNVPDSGDVWVGWRSGHMLMVAFAAMAGVWLTRTWQRPRGRAVLIAALALAIVPAIPTVALDVYNAQDISNRREGADFPWTLVITPAEREALDWVRQSTPADAVVQFEPEARGTAHWSLIGAMAERRMIAGLPIAMTPLRPYQHASDAVQWGVFRASLVGDSHAAARSLGIDYLFIGLPERRRYRPSIEAMQQNPTLFPIVFRNESITILRVAPIDPAPGGAEGR